MQTNLDQFIAVPIQSFRSSVRDICFDVYLRIADDHFAHIFSKNTGLDYKRLAHYIYKGVDSLYVKTEDHGKYLDWQKETIEAREWKEETPKEKKIATLLNMTEQNMSEIFCQLNVPEDTAKNTEQVVKNYVQLMVEHPTSLALMLKLVSQGEYLYYHSLAVSIFSLFAAKATGQFSAKALNDIGVGAFLHDIGIAQLLSGGSTLGVQSTAQAQFQMNATKMIDESDPAIRDHPKVGLQMLESAKHLADDVRFIVYQHHELPSGSGFPNRLKAAAIFYPARIVSAVDELTLLMSQRNLKIDQAVEQLKKDRGKFDGEIISTLASLFKDGLKKRAA